MRLETKPKFIQREFDTEISEHETETSSAAMEDNSKSHRHRRRHRHSSQRSSSRSNLQNKRKSSRKMKTFGSRFLFGLFQLFHTVINAVLDWVLAWHWGDRKKCPALTTNLFLTKSAIELSKMIRSKEITSEALVNACIQRIYETNKLLNYITDGPYDDAVEFAKAIDVLIQSNEITDEEFASKPFLGVPFTTKESIAAVGKLHTFGLISRRNVRATEDAECVRLIKNAGGILLALTNVPELNRWQETRNNVYGQTNNPYDSRRTVGGSSGGEGAIISACGSPFGIGSDIGGSIRMPAFYCGIFGHKPTGHLVNIRGCTLRTGEEKQTMVVAGPMTRHACDLMPLLKVLAGPENSSNLMLDEKVDVKKLRYFYVSNNGEYRSSPISGDLQNAMKKVVTHFQTLTGQPVNCAQLSGIDYSTKIWRYWATQEETSFTEMLGNGRHIDPLTEVGKYLIGQSEFTIAALYPVIDENIFPRENEGRIRKITQKLEDELNELLGDDGILLYHNTSIPAPFHYQSLFKVYNFSYWGLFNVLEVPATQVPLGLNADGLPLGIQIVATKNRDRDCLAVAEEISKAFGGWVAPFEVVN